MQIIGTFFGAQVVGAKEPVHGKVRSVYHRQVGVFKGLPSPLRVTRYHSLVVARDGLPECLKVTAESGEGEAMGLQHDRYPISGVQFHPEALLTECGLDLLCNALEEGTAV